MQPFHSRFLQSLFQDLQQSRHTAFVLQQMRFGRDSRGAHAEVDWGGSAFSSADLHLARQRLYRHLKALCQSTHLTQVKTTLAGKHSRHNTLRPYFRQVALAQAVLLH